MKIKNVELKRTQEQEIECSEVLNVTVQGGNIIASVAEGDKELKLAIVKDEIEGNAKYIATLHEPCEINHVFLIEESKKKSE